MLVTLHCSTLSQFKNLYFIECFMTNKFGLCVSFLLWYAVLLPAKLVFDIQKPDANYKRNFTVTVQQAADEYTYYDSLQVNVSSPHIIIDSWNIEGTVVEIFDVRFQESKKILKDNFLIKGILSESASDGQAALVVGLFTNLLTAPEVSAFSITAPTLTANSPVVAGRKHSEHVAQSVSAPATAVTCAAPHQKRGALSDYVQRLLATSSYLWAKLLLALILGILMSLTPCIYPMIPITVSILQGRGQRSFIYNFFLALSYTFGIALMFAVLGLSAALTGALFGSLLSKPFVVIVIVLILAYLGLSMFGLYELRLPSWFARSTDIKPTGSFVSAFVFGVLSGTIASPCLSPGLAFLLSIVATLGNKLLGFVLLFMFGVGMSIPLLLIGTIAPALRFMPKSGLWMVEIKKIFGILLFALCFYYMSNVLSVILLLWLLASSLLLFGLYELFMVRKQSSFGARVMRILFGTSAVVGAVFLYALALQKTWSATEKSSLVHWRFNYRLAHEEARQANKLLFVDVGATYCSICNAIDRCILNDVYIASLINHMVPVKIDAGKSAEFGELSKQFNISGVPALLVVQPNSQIVQQRWGAEFYSLNKTEIGSQLGVLLNQQTK